MELMENIGWQAGDSFEPASTNIRPKSLNFNKNSEGKQKLDLGNLGKNVQMFQKTLAKSWRSQSLAMFANNNPVIFLCVPAVEVYWRTYR